ncbi:influenza virus NS1A-binding protein homolog A [Ricinus communis]|uniref:influenza virus NS1A-binding protein homolog A n=1 Tax=Ricinus communis TaxID=3988 RepID=UPI0007721CFD|nr:influenza virus NS1A-binding protein homolog A [Ricinus communis]|eukprot:XP_015576172.1 influenza virus NS1A-binding protein homolog A [Ricinus communis]
MGALPSPPRLTTPQPSPSPEFSLSKYRVCASFCHQNISNWIECYDPSNNTWSHLSLIPGLIDNHVLKDFVMVSLGNSIYIIGGRLCHRERSSSEYDEISDSEIEVRSKVLRYNIILNEWFECASLKIPRYDFACTTCKNKIYVAGGKSNLGSARGTSSAEVYDPIADEWTPLPSMSTLRYKCVGVTFQGKIHVVGGFAVRVDSDKTEPFVTERSSAEVYDTRAGKWDLVAGMWQLDVPPYQIVAIGERLLSSGDCLKAWKGHIEAYDGRLNMWDVVDGSHLQTLNSPISTSAANSKHWSPSQRLYLTMAPIGTHLYFLAGYRMAGELPRTVSTVHSFDTSAKDHAWRRFEPVEEEGEKVLCSHCCVVQIS